MMERKQQKKNPFPLADNNKRYYTYDYFLKEKFGGKVAKLPIDGGFTCPNIDGTKGRGGCLYCSCKGLPGRGKTIAEQIGNAKAVAERKWGKQMEVKRYIAYFQMFTNTYAPLDTLKRLYEEALAQEDVVGISIATRGDCIQEETAKYLRNLAQQTFVTVELGLQTVHEQTAQDINRCHSYTDFLEGFYRLEGVHRCVHLINGLPGETRSMMLETAERMAELHPEQLKLHLLYVIRGTGMERLFLNGELVPMRQEDYISLVVSQLERLPGNIVIGRVTGDASEDELVAPLWSKNKRAILNGIDKTFAKLDTWQGKLYNMDK